ncbi:hypothetical protein ACI2OX_14540 [Bacillus sp. N9]
MVHPDLLNGWGYGGALVSGDIPVWNIFGFEIEKIGYQGTVLLCLHLPLFWRKRKRVYARSSHLRWIIY